jgi:peptidylprolyl isomerase
VRTHLNRCAALAAVVLLSVVAACSSSSSPTSSASTHRPPKHEAIAVGGCIMSVSIDPATKPTLSVPDSPACTTPPTTLAYADAIAGSGPAAKRGDSLTVKYVGLHWSTKQPFQASWDATPQTFDVSPLGTASVIAGWNEALVGVRAGARRVLAVPAALAYGPAGSGTEIGPNEALIFIIDVVSVSSGASASPSG